MSKESEFNRVRQEMLLAVYNRPMLRIIEESPGQEKNKVQDAVASGRVHLVDLSGEQQRLLLNLNTKQSIPGFGRRMVLGEQRSSDLEQRASEGI